MPDAPRAFRVERIGRDKLEAPIRDYVHQDVVTLPTGATVAEVLEGLRSRPPQGSIIYFYAVDADGRLKGVVPTRRMLTAAPEARIAELMTRVISIPEAATVMEACEFFVLHHFLAFPVVDSGGRLVGVVDVNLFTDEVFDISENRAAADLFQLIGVRAAEARKSWPWGAFRDRFPWLLCNIGGGVLCAMVASRYDELLSQFVVLALFLPVVLALSESVSIQAMTLTLQSFHAAGVKLGAFLGAVARELVTASLMGLAAGSLVGAVSWIWQGKPLAALAIGGSIALAVLTAGVLGIVLPTLVRAFKGDPKVAAGPVVLAAGDVLCVLFYMNLAGWLLK
ncbi:MAG TPA: magnesium transporter [Planctomycetota bacterium]|nr:magnesium transporter [Planctomycetota bacterium]